LNHTSGKLVLRALNQAARELLLAQSSDWAFMMKAGRYAPYAEQRIKIHLNRFYQLADSIRRNHVSEAYLSDLEEQDNLFKKMDYQVFKKHLR
jgi:1,4-alpha-glucan branching enzyme